MKTLGERGIECIFVGYAKHSKAFMLYVIEPNESVSINTIIESRDAIFDENIFSLVPRPSQRSLINRTEDIDGLVVLEEVTEEVVAQQPEPELRKGKRNRTSKNFGPELQLYLIERTRGETMTRLSKLGNYRADQVNSVESTQNSIAMRGDCANIGTIRLRRDRRVLVMVAKLPTQESGPLTALKMTVPSTAEEKICKKNDVKARSLLLMAPPNEHQLTFN
ncbi:hypothetical protein Tco_0661892 [Tanacetum coccineum]